MHPPECSEAKTYVLVQSISLPSDEEIDQFIGITTPSTSTIKRRENMLLLRTTTTYYPQYLTSSDELVVIVEPTRALENRLYALLHGAKKIGKTPINEMTESDLIWAIRSTVGALRGLLEK